VKGTVLLQGAVSAFVAFILFIAIANVAPAGSFLRGGSKDSTTPVSQIDNDQNPADEIDVAIQTDSDENGNDGQDGADGNSGSDGRNGPSGTSGQDGSNGQSGAEGQNGSNGLNGAAGNNGQNGNDGSTGSNGSNGSDGQNGFNGGNGSDGNEGAQGPQGTQGETGATGAQGQQGNNGSNGSDGSIGQTGATGATGAQGAQGIQGDQATDDQTLGYVSGTQILSIAGGNSVDLGSLLDNTDLLASLSCSNNQIAKYVSSTWVCSTDEVGSIAANSLNYTDFSNALSLDATTTVAYGAFNQVQNLDGTGDFLIQDNGTTILSVLDSGTFEFRNSTNNTAGFVISQAGGTRLFTIDSVNSRIAIGNPVADTVGALLVLDNKTTAGDPAGTNGATYYNSFLAKFRCYENDQWRDCNRTARTSYTYFNDFMGATSDGRVTFAVTGTGAVNSVTNINSIANHPGILQQGTGTTTTGNARGISSATNGLLLGNGTNWQFEGLVRIPVLSTATDRFNYRVGFMDNAPADSTDGCLFSYTDSVTSGNWQGICRNNNVESSCDTGLPVAVNTWYRLGVTVNATGTSAGFTVNGTTPLCEVTTNIPIGPGRGTSFGTKIIKSVGTIARTTEVDYLEIRGEFTTPR